MTLPGPWDVEALGRFFSTLAADTLEYEKDLKRAGNFFRYARQCFDYKEKFQI